VGRRIEGKDKKKGPGSESWLMDQDCSHFPRLFAGKPPGHNLAFLLLWVYVIPLLTGANGIWHMIYDSCVFTWSASVTDSFELASHILADGFACTVPKYGTCPLVGKAMMCRLQHTRPVLKTFLGLAGRTLMSHCHHRDKEETYSLHGPKTSSRGFLVQYTTRI
jgi:hypothetical protein